jgi:hypothetical protein
MAFREIVGTGIQTRHFKQRAPVLTLEPDKICTMGSRIEGSAHDRYRRCEQRGPRHAALAGWRITKSTETRWSSPSLRWGLKPLCAMPYASLESKTFYSSVDPPKASYSTPMVVRMGKAFMHLRIIASA